jgi:nicotinate-nucleotide adenylyltransferase
MRIGIFGGTFNPIHYGHLRAAEEAREVLDLDKILFIPSGNPPLKTKELAGAVHRYKMTRLAVLKNRSFDVLDIECARSGKSYTVRTIEALRKIHKDSELFFVLGIDTFLDIKNWWKPEKLLSLINFAVLSRPGNWFIDLLTSPYLELKKSLLSRLDRGETETFSSELRSGKKLVLLRITPVAISSTEIRKRIKEGLTIKYMLPEEVESYIIFNKLYRME